MGTAFAEGQNVHFDSGHDEFLLYAHRNNRNTIFIQNVCRALGCTADVILLACVPRWVNREVPPTLILVSEERARELVENFPNIIHFVPEEG